MAKFGLFRGDEMVGRVIYNNLESAKKEEASWNKQFESYNKKILDNPALKGEKPIAFVEVREYKKKRQTQEQKLREMFG